MVIANKNLIAGVKVDFIYPDTLVSETKIGDKTVAIFNYDHKGEGKYLYRGWKDEVANYIDFQVFLEDESTEYLAEFNQEDAKVSPEEKKEPVTVLLYDKEKKSISRVPVTDDNKEYLEFLENSENPEENLELFKTEEAFHSYLENEKLLSVKDVVNLIITTSPELEGISLSALPNKIFKILKHYVCQ